MSELDDDIARGCLKNGEPLEARRGSGWWSARPEQEQEQAPTDMDIWNDLQRQNDQLRAENERLREAIMLLQNWVKAYPLKVFPEPDLKLARKLLTDGGVSYDALNVYSMRHVINGVGKIINETLDEVDE
jgi:hypothetical protein